LNLPPRRGIVTFRVRRMAIKSVGPETLKEDKASPEVIDLATVMYEFPETTTPLWRTFRKMPTESGVERDILSERRHGGG